MKNIGRQLITTNSDRISLTKLWSFVAYAVSTWVIVYMTLKDRMTAELLLIYLGTVGGVSQVSKWLAYKYNSNIESANAKQAESIAVSKCPDCPVPTKPIESQSIPEGD